MADGKFDGVQAQFSDKGLNADFAVLALVTCTLHHRRFSLPRRESHVLYPKGFFSTSKNPAHAHKNFRREIIAL